MIDYFDNEDNTNNSEADINQSNKNSKWSSEVEQLLKKDLVEANGNSSEYKNNELLTSRQRAILELLPENFIEELTAYLQSTYIEQSKYPTFNPDKNFDKNILTGEVFESLIEIEDELYHFDPNWKEHVQTDEQKRLGEQILKVMATPGRYNLEESPVMNPDKTKIIFEKYVFLVNASIEAKTHMDERSLKQLKKFRKSFEKISELINNMTDAASHGLEGLGKDGSKIGISDKYYQILAVPRNAILEDTFKKSLFFDNRMREDKRKELISILNDSSQITIARSSFSSAEIAALTRYFQKKVYQRLENQAEQLSE